MIQAFENMMKDLVPTPSTHPSTHPPALSSTTLSTKLSTGLSQNQLCKHFGIESKNVAVNAKRRGITSHQYLEERTSWRFNLDDRKYYSPD